MRYAWSMPALDLASRIASGSLRIEPWLWSARRDLCVFAGSALLALSIVALGHASGFAGGALPDWAFLVLVLGVDVAHVYGTLFRTYLDGAELRARRLRYALTPLASYALGVAAYSLAPWLFWRVLAYLALFHFVRQELGWLRLQRAKSHAARFDARLDELALYVGALYPVLVWHAELHSRQFSWFVSGDFVALPARFAAVLPLARALWLTVLGLFAGRQLWLLVYHRLVRPLPWLIVGKTAIIWYVGIVYCNSDFDFTLTNVLAHGIPYLALTWGYARERERDAPRALGARVVGLGFWAFFGLLLILAAGEEWGWDHWLFHDREWLFGPGPELGGSALSWLVPMLAVPQVTHYLLDAKLWRSAETRRLPAQQRALGFSSSEART